MKYPLRIQRKRTKGWRMPAGAVSITRPGKWGNPFAVVAEDGGFWVKDPEDNYWGEWYATKQEAVAKAVRLFSPWVEGKIDSNELNIDELCGKDLACWCREGTPCHGDVLLKLANS